MTGTMGLKKFEKVFQKGKLIVDAMSSMKPSSSTVAVERSSLNMDAPDSKQSATPHEVSVPRNMTPPPATVTAAAKPSSAAIIATPTTTNNNKIHGIESKIVTVLAAYHVWTCRESIIANQFPVSIVSIFVGAAYLLGLKIGTRSSIVKEEEEKKEEEDDYDYDDEAELLLRDKPGEDELADEAGKRWNSRPKFRTRKRVKRASILSQCPTSKREVKEWELKINAPFTNGQLMDHLHKYSDFRKHSKKLLKKLRDGNAAADAAADEKPDVGGDDESQRTDNISIGKIELNDTRAKALESSEHFLHVVDPICKLRGMDLFLTEDPQKCIWRQPVLCE
jgi:hypothetical protein